MPFLCFKAAYEEGSRDEYPEIYLNDPQANRKQDFPKNEIWTTKYNIFTFLPKVLYEQFRKFTSLYFLMVCILSFFPAISPVNPWSSVSGLLFILGVSMIREAVEDFFRLKADLSSNRRRFVTIEPNTGKQVTTRCESIRVGDLVYLKANQIVPADLVVMASSLDDTVCYIETAQLDGETNLKQRRGSPGTLGLTMEEVAKVRGILKCDTPQHELYKFKGTLDIQSLSPDFVPRGEQGLRSEEKWSSIREDHSKSDDERATSARLLGLPPDPISTGSSSSTSFDVAGTKSVNTEVMTPPLPPMSRVQSVVGIDPAGPKRASGPSVSSLGEDNMLPRGSVLRNTPWMVGLVAYAGPETKMSLNTKTPPSKFSSLDKRINKYVFLIFVLQSLLIFVCAVYAGIYEGQEAANKWYLGVDEEDANGYDATQTAVFSFFSYFILMSYLIPISLVVTLEVTKVVQGRFMEWDEKMHFERQRMTVKTSNLNDELGLVQYLFSDKTGTLTQNQMDFKKVAVRGRVCHDATCGKLFDMFKHAPSDREARDTFETLMCLALCHSVVPDDSQEELLYKAASPDEEALVRGASDNGFVFLHRDSAGVDLEIDGNQERIEVLLTMPFTSERRRMSVIVRLRDGTIRMFSKGADGTMLARLSPKEDQNVVERSKENLELFSQEGLRTLVLCSKDLSKDDYRAFAREYANAANLINDREEEVERVCDKMERGFFIVGCTAIEDKLQEYVPETIAYLLAAGIRVWVITGDKQATAINIGYSTRLLTKDMKVVKLNADSEAELREMLEENIYNCRNIKEGRQFEAASSPSLVKGEEGINSFAMVIDGQTLQFGLENCPELLLEFAQMCHSVICCRVAPLQKAAVVKLVKDSLDCITLSIGDGGNDVSMIQEANIGVGIYGKEGSQAARSSDYAIHRFHHVQRLLTVHGRYSLVRNALLTHYSFYKNAAIFLIQIWFSFYSGCSGQSFYDDWIMTFFNIYITALPPFILGVFEKDISDATIARYPQTYVRTQRNRIFTLGTLCAWMASAVYHSLVLFYGAYFLFYDTNASPNGQDTSGLSMMGMWVIIVGMGVIFSKLFFEVQAWSAPMHLAVWLSLIVFFLTIFAENSIPFLFPSQYYVVWKTFNCPSFWFWFFWTVFVCNIPDLITKYVQRQYYPEPWQLLQEREILDRKRGGGTERSSLLVSSPSVHMEVDDLEPMKF